MLGEGKELFVNFSRVTSKYLEFLTFNQIREFSTFADKSLEKGASHFNEGAVLSGTDSPVSLVGGRCINVDGFLLRNAGDVAARPSLTKRSVKSKEFVEASHHLEFTLLIFSFTSVFNSTANLNRV